uniref:GH18 domain-containing protein n=1 Tax=Anopheles minimus TaxID=112268 RepID=A0A182W236_9DIPT
MEPRKIVLVLLQLVGYGAVEGLDIICQIQLQLPIENTIKRSNSTADVLLTIVLPFNVTALSVHQKLSERINIVLRDNVLDGVDLDFDIALLDYYEQLRYGQFLRRLRSVLSDKYTISTTIGCYTMGSSKALLKAFNDHVNLVSVVGVNMLEDELVNRSKEEFLLREYGTAFISRLLQDGLRADKIVLSVLTEKQAKCGSRASSKRPECSLFAGTGAVVYDNEKTVEKRVLQAHSLDAVGTDKNVPFETFPNQRVPSPVDSPYAAEFLHHLYGYRVRYVPHLHRYALLLSAIETVVLSLYALLTQAGWDHRLQWRPLWHIPKYLRINFALVMSLLTIYSNLAAIVGLLMYRKFLLWPYICLHLGTFALELWYLMGNKLASLPPVCLRKFDLNVCRNETDKWWSPLMVFLLGLNLSIVIAVYLQVDVLRLA